MTCRQGANKLGLLPNHHGLSAPELQYCLSYIFQCEVAGVADRGPHS